MKVMRKVMKVLMRATAAVPDEILNKKVLERGWR